jgi:hypothetical protein
MRRSGAMRVGLFLLALSGCGGTVVFEVGGDEGGGGMGPVGSTGSATAASATTGGGPGGASSTSGDPVVASAVGAGGAAAGELVVSIVDVDLTADCMPVVGPDPVSGSVVVKYENVGTGSTRATDVRIDLVYTNEVEGWVFPIAVAPAESSPIPPGESRAVEHVKVETAGDASFICSLCGAEGVVALHGLDAASRELSASAPLRLACAL